MPYWFLSSHIVLDLGKSARHDSLDFFPPLRSPAFVCFFCVDMSSICESQLHHKKRLRLDEVHKKQLLFRHGDSLGSWAEASSGRRWTEERVSWGEEEWVWELRWRGERWTRREDQREHRAVEGVSLRRDASSPGVQPSIHLRLGADGVRCELPGRCSRNVFRLLWQINSRDYRMRFSDIVFDLFSLVLLAVVLLLHCLEPHRPLQNMWLKDNENCKNIPRTSPKFKPLKLKHRGLLLWYCCVSFCRKLGLNVANYRNTHKILLQNIKIYLVLHVIWWTNI